MKNAAKPGRRLVDKTLPAIFRRIIDSIPQPIFVWDADGRVLHANPGVVEYFGIPTEELKANNIRSRVFHPDDRDRIGTKLRQGILSGVAFELEARFLRGDGVYRWFRVRLNPLRNGMGRIRYWFGARTDIEDYKQADEQLRLMLESMRQTQRHFAEAQALSHTGSWAYDLVLGKPIYWSDEQYRICGLDPHESLDTAARKAYERIHPEDLNKYRVVEETAIRNKTDFTVEFRINLPDGSVKYIRSLAHPVVDDHGNVVELRGTAIDITEQHRAELVLKEALEENQDLKDQLYRENLVLKEEIERSSIFEEIVGRSPALQEVLRQIAKVAPTDSTILITGETGTGKELIARAIHKHSQRASRAFVSVNCAAIPPSLIATELFGHEKGAFTGALQRRLGRFELAEGGTIFLDEIGDLPPETQIALLRVLQERQFERVGGHHVIQADVRIIAATHADLPAAIHAGTFRNDLFYRLNVFPIVVPSLRDRKEDIPPLVEYFVRRYAAKAGRTIRSIEQETLRLLKGYSWPGNIRELQNLIERSVILSDREILSVDERWLAHKSFQMPSPGVTLLRRSPSEVRKMIQDALAETNGKVAGPSGAAAKLGIPSSTLDSKIKSLRIDKRRFKNRTGIKQ